MPKKRQSFADWNLQVAEVLASIHDLDRLPQTLIRVLRTLAPAAGAYAGLYRRKRRPVQVWMEPGAAVPEWPEYFRGFYAVDPFYIAYREGRSGCLHLREIMPAGFEETEYFRQMYTRQGLGDELVHLTLLPDTGSVAIGFHRSHEQGVFSEAEVSRHEAANPLVAACSLHLAKLAPDVDDPEESSLAEKIESALDRFGADRLTAREHEVVDLVLRGHNTESAAEQLRIARDTVKLHRKRAYSKLQVSSQGELFFKFLESLGLGVRA
jgi:DNA-binding CsgD family transcriptional regulator